MAGYGLLFMDLEKVLAEAMSSSMSLAEDLQVMESVYTLLV